MSVVLATSRLVLRHLVPADLDDLDTLYRDPEIRRYFPEGVLTREQTREELLWFEHGHPRRPELGLWATILPRARWWRTASSSWRCRGSSP